MDGQNLKKTTTTNKENNTIKSSRSFLKKRWKTL